MQFVDVTVAVQVPSRAVLVTVVSPRLVLSVPPPTGFEPRLAVTGVVMASAARAGPPDEATRRIAAAVSVESRPVTGGSLFGVGMLVMFARRWRRRGSAS
ncbi:hypothetical protein FraQA3DRAFT_0018 [Frankia sp. QA3]|nr:hypothetical protein FraQA3DRAFT_0018 [Frankia sp. QA3]